MQRHTFFLVLAVTGVLAACATTDALLNEGRRSYVQEHELTGTDSVHVMEGRIYRGMPIEHALAALGSPATQDTITTEDGSPRIEYMYRSGPNAFDPGNVHRAYVYADDQKVMDWKDLDKIPRFDAYYEGGM